MAIAGNLNSAQCVTSGAGAAVSFTVGPGQSLPSGTLIWSYSSAPTGGGLTIADGTNTYLTVDIIAGGPAYLPLTNGLGGMADASNGTRTLTVTLAGGGGSVVGKLTYIHG